MLFYHSTEVCLLFEKLKIQKLMIPRCAGPLSSHVMYCLNCEKVWLQGCQFFSFAYRSNNDNGCSSCMSKDIEIVLIWDF